MPNWCQNNLRVEGDEATVKEFRGNALSTYKNEWMDNPKPELYELSFHKIVPCPKKPKIGCREWQIENWGTKWDTKDAVVVREEYKDTGAYLEYNFDTAWSPPEGWVLKASKKFPHLKFTAMFIEYGAGFRGHFIAQNGEIIEEHSEDIPEELYSEDNENCYY